MKNLMVDIETLGTRPGCIILSVSAVEFNVDDITSYMFDMPVDPRSCELLGLKTSIDTVMWWMKQDQKARDRVADGGVDIKRVLELFSSSWGPWKDTRIWCNGASFDFPILTAAYEAAGMQAPWPYYNERCYRTMKGGVPRDAYDKCLIPPAVAHNALYDAISQARTLISMVKAGLLPMSLID